MLTAGATLFHARSLLAQTAAASPTATATGTPTWSPPGTVLTSPLLSSLVSDLLRSRAVRERLNRDPAGVVNEYGLTDLQKAAFYSMKLADMSTFIGKENTMVACRLRESGFQRVLALRRPGTGSKRLLRHQHRGQLSRSNARDLSDPAVHDQRENPQHLRRLRPVFPARRRARSGSQHQHQGGSDSRQRNVPFFPPLREGNGRPGGREVQPQPGPALISSGSAPSLRRCVWIAISAT